MPETIAVDVVCAWPDRAIARHLRVPVGTRLQAAVELSGLLRDLPDLPWPQSPVGIFGRVVSLAQELRDGDRVEIYRPLAVDPKAARRERARAERASRSRKPG